MGRVVSEFDGYVIVDVETTGLDPVLDTILELGILIADKYFNVLSEFNMVNHFDFELGKAGIDGFVIDMHSNNGLWDECQASNFSLKTVEKQAQNFLTDGGWNNQPMCGSTIQFDRSFLAEWMPELNRTFHYRHIDVSSLKNVWNKYGWPKGYLTKDGKHRSLPDCYDTLNELRGYVLHAERAFNLAAFR